jgi:polyhydroxyalkanoate synthesis regulator protein
MAAVEKKRKEGGDVMGTMTLRDYFAAKAMQGLLASEVNASLKVFAKQAYAVADEMMEARNGSQ